MFQESRTVQEEEQMNRNSPGYQKW